MQSVEGLLTAAGGIDFVIVEASGVAEPQGIVMTFLDRRYEGLFVLDGIICLVDAEGIFRYGDDDQLRGERGQEEACVRIVDRTCVRWPFDYSASSTGGMVALSR